MAALLCLPLVVAFAQTAPQASPAAAASPATAGAGAGGTVDETTFTIPDSPQATGPAASNAPGFGIWDLVRMVVILALVVAAIYGVFWIIRRGSGQKKIEETELIKLLGSQGLPGNRWLHLVSVQKQVFLIGSSDSSVGLIAEITDQESIDEIRLQAATAAPAGKKTFAELIGGFFGGGPGGPGSPGAGSGAPGGKGGLDLLRRQRDRLKGL